MLEQRYVIVDVRCKSGDIFTDILDAGTAEKDARAKLESSYSYLTKEEQKDSMMTLALIAVADGDRIITTEDGEAEEAAANGWQTISGYTPIAEMGAAKE